MSQDPRHRLVSVTLDEASIGRAGTEQEHERAIAIYDLIESNQFIIPDHDGGPYSLTVSLITNKLALDIKDHSGAPVIIHILSLTPFRRVIKDYFLICESYYNAIRSASLELRHAIIVDLFDSEDVHRQSSGPLHSTNRCSSSKCKWCKNR